PAQGPQPQPHHHGKPKLPMNTTLFLGKHHLLPFHQLHLPFEFLQLLFQLPPRQLLPLQLLRPLQLRPFQLRPLQLAPFQLRPFHAPARFQCAPHASLSARAKRAPRGPLPPRESPPAAIPRESPPRHIPPWPPPPPRPPPR